ncbi:heterokaryon incompatibility protein-domain-containing protein [Cercophora newfieldiana]|uniref:Heterokaryon incompatibility protein-domain-containing protein n=1 Tax=Cercophora newfieldiana TaxID=92897 RepID=A0AA40CT34_9PEZI|nr:heterokaryon incompatibility protein-domain-containing protein [Cercophora newfieldiana]
MDTDTDTDMDTTGMDITDAGAMAGMDTDTMDITDTGRMEGILPSGRTVAGTTGIRAATLELQAFLGQDIPPYAILSHTWGDDEVSLQEFQQGRGKNTQGFQKVVETCRLARDLGLDFAWIDTCCIDKSSSAELSEAINSMFRWYQEAQACFVYLSDFPLSWSQYDPVDGWDRAQIRHALPGCRWFTRGWTLQELIASRAINFHNSVWEFLGTKLDFLDLLVEVTGVRSSVLEDFEELDLIPAAEKMAWASQRSTTRVEDAAYCLLGLFGVNMPLLYGEGTKAFRRLQEEVLKKTNDLSLLAWTPTDPGEEMRGAWARSPKEFSWLAKDRIELTITSQYSMEVEITSKGIRLLTQLRNLEQKIEGESRDPGPSSGRPCDVLALGCYIRTWKSKHTVSRGGPLRREVIGIGLRKFGPSWYIRDLDMSTTGQVIRWFDNPFAVTDSASLHPSRTMWLQTEDKHVPFWISRKESSLGTLQLRKPRFYRELNACKFGDGNCTMSDFAEPCQLPDIHFRSHPCIREFNPLHGDVWDHTTRTFFTGWAMPREWDALQLAVELESNDRWVRRYKLLVICGHLFHNPWILLLEPGDSLEKKVLDSKRNRLRPEQDIYMLGQLKDTYNDSLIQGGFAELRTETLDGRWEIQTKREHEIVPDISPTRQVASISFKFTEL